MKTAASRVLQSRGVLGVILMILGLALYSFSDAFLKHLMGVYTVPQATFLRAFTRLVPLLIAVVFQGGFRAVLATQHPRQHLIRLLVNLAYTYAFMCAVKFAPLTTVYTLSYTSPFFMIILSSLLLQEQVTREKWIAVGMGLLGVMIAMRPGSSVFEVAALLTLAGTFLGALNKILMRRLASTEHSLAIAIYPNVVMILVNLPFLMTHWQSMPWAHWIVFGCVGILTAGGQYAIAQALRYAQGSTLAPIDYSTFFWVVAIDLLWWGKHPDTYVVVGAAVIVGSNLYILYRTKKEAKKEASKCVPCPDTIEGNANGN